MGSVSPEHPASELAGRFAHTLTPIAFGYLVAHYFSLLVTQGLGLHRFSNAAIWYVQVAALIAGHVSGLALAHDRALVVYGDPEQAAASQRWMLVVMVTFTCLGLWLLSAVNT
jgi:hypothetical protein